ncbi:MAG TPA: hypothetical protein VGJ00_09945 [Rhabdochlamydiaceae bacterium]|jgi:hypothetical protein
MTAISNNAYSLTIRDFDTSKDPLNKLRESPIQELTLINGKITEKMLETIVESGIKTLILQECTLKHSHAQFLPGTKERVIFNRCIIAKGSQTTRIEVAECLKAENEIIVYDPRTIFNHMAESDAVFFAALNETPPIEQEEEEEELPNEAQMYEQQVNRRQKLLLEIEVFLKKRLPSIDGIDAYLVFAEAKRALEQEMNDAEMILNLLDRERADLSENGRSFTCEELTYQSRLITKVNNDVEAAFTKYQTSIPKDD